MVCSWAYLTTFVLAVPGSWLAKAVMALAITLLYWLMWPGFGLDSTRAYAAVKRSGTMVQETGRSLITSARVHALSEKGRI